MNLSWRDAIIEVLKEEDSAMHYADIAERIVDKNLRTSVGATPANTVGAVITTDIKEFGAASVFVRSERGRYMLRSHETQQVDEELSEEVESDSGRIVKAFGMFWRRDWVDWKTAPRIWGQQSKGAQNVDFRTQRGVYLLHDRNMTVYVGQAFDQPIASRLYSHTSGRLSGRWDRFSWFGLMGVTENGCLREEDLKRQVDLSLAVNDLEGVLMEALEAPMNRRAGEGFKAIEYHQIKDEELDKAHLKSLLREIESQL